MDFSPLLEWAFFLHVQHLVAVTPFSAIGMMA
jgi:hypothetical protein